MKPIESSITFEQEADACGNADPNTIKISTANGGTSDDDVYLVIETTRWAVDVDNIDELVGMLKRVVDVTKGSVSE